LNELGDVGITVNGIKSDVGDGSLGAYNVNFWLLGFRALVRVRLERVEIQVNNLTRQDLDQLEGAVIKLIRALSKADPKSVIASYTIDLGLHGSLVGTDPKGHLGRFLRAAPNSSTPLIGCGVVFYLGADDIATVRSVTADLSGVLPGNLYVRLFSVYSNSVQPSGLRQVIDKDARDALALLGLAAEAS
jgi:hypothetical protein